MKDHILFLTGKLAEKSLRRVLDAMQPQEFTWEVRQLGLSVAALMTADLIRRRLGETGNATRVIVPGLCRGDLDRLTREFGIPVVRGTDDLKDLPAFFGRDCKPPDLSRYDVRIFAEIVDAPEIDTDTILERAAALVADGANVIDIGCLPDTPFPHMEEAIAALRSRGYEVSIDSVDPGDLLRGARAGAAYLLSLSAETLHLAEEVEAVPVLIPERPGDMDSLYRAIDTLAAAGQRFIADSVLDPIHFGFAESLCRYGELRRRYPEVEIMMGTGNLTELTEADTTGINALLFGIISELRITNVLTTQVSPHARCVVRESDRARRIMYAARAEQGLPKGLDGGLASLHERKPFVFSEQEVRELAEQIRDPNYRVQVTEAGIHVFNRDGMHTGEDPFELFPALAQLRGDAPHAFYLGVELARAQIAWRLGKRYVQDRELDWGVAVHGAEADDRNNEAFKPAGPTLEAARAERRRNGGK